MNNNELFELFETIIKDFNLKGDLIDIRMISTGNINDTYVARTAFHNGEKLYIIQSAPIPGWCLSSGDWVWGRSLPE